MSTQELQQPGYNPAHITPGIAHFGVGSFHRSHQAMYIDRLIESGGHDDWGIIGIGVMPGDARMRDALAGQDFRYTLTEKYGDGHITACEIKSISHYIYAPEYPVAVLETLARPSIRIVSLTITEGGYTVDLDNPGSGFGYITEALRIRRDNGIAPFTVMSCDNLPGNGDVTRQAVLAYAGALDQDLAQWIEAKVAFPNSMVDRITPVTTDADRAMVTNLFGIDDAWPVVTEPFTQWVLEDNFCNARPAFEQVGVQIVEDVAPYELMKLRLLNASHQAMAYIGMLLGHTYVHEAVADPDIERFLRAYLAEARVTLDPVPGIDVDEYIEVLFERFGNPYIADTLARLAVDASDRIPKFVLPAVRENLEANRDVVIGAAVVASWARYMDVTPNHLIIDPMAPSLIPLVNDPLTFVQFKPVFGEIKDDPRFNEAYVKQASSLRSLSSREWLRQLSDPATG